MSRNFLLYYLDIIDVRQRGIFMNQLQVHLRQTLFRTKRAKLTTIIITFIVMSIVLSLALCANNANNVAKDYQSEVTEFKKAVVDYDGRDAKTVTDFFKKTPELQPAILGSLISSEYKQANSTHQLLRDYKNIASDIDKRIATSSDPFSKKLQALVFKHRATEKAITAASKLKEDELAATPEAIKIGIAPFEKLKTVRIDTYNKIISDIQSHIDEANKLDASQGLEDIKSYYLELLNQDKTLNVRYRDTLNSIATYGALDRANSAYPIERQFISDEIVASVYSAVALQADQFSLALSLQYGLKDDIGPLTSYSNFEEARARASIGLYSRYTRYASTKNVTSSSSQVNTGATYFGLFMAQRAANKLASFNKNDADNFKTQLTSAKGAADVLFIGRSSAGIGVRNTDRIFDTTEIITKLGDTSGFQLAANQVGEENKASNIEIDVAATKKYAHDLIDRTLPDTKSHSSEYKSFKQAAKKCVDGRLALYSSAKTDFIELNSIDESRRKLIASIKQNGSKENQDKIQMELKSLEIRFDKVKVRISSAQNVSEKSTTECTQNLENTQNALINRTKEQMPYVDELYNQLIVITNLAAKQQR